MHCVNFFRNIYRKYSKATEQTGGFSLASCCLTTFSIQTDTEGWEVHAAGVSGSPLAAPLAQVLNSLTCDNYGGEDFSAVGCWSDKAQGLSAG